jgi:hypothetical protein
VPPPVSFWCYDLHACVLRCPGPSSWLLHCRLGKTAGSTALCPLWSVFPVQLHSGVEWCGLECSGLRVSSAVVATFVCSSACPSACTRLFLYIHSRCCIRMWCCTSPPPPLAGAQPRPFAQGSVDCALPAALKMHELVAVPGCTSLQHTVLAELVFECEACGACYSMWAQVSCWAHSRKSVVVPEWVWPHPMVPAAVAHGSLCQLAEGWSTIAACVAAGPRQGLRPCGNWWYCW